MMTYEQVSKLPRSEKIILITCEAAQLAKLFDQFDTSIYVRDVPYFVSGIKLGAPSRQDQAESIEDLGPTKPWFYDIQNKKLYLSLFINPKTINVTIIYKFFFSNTPLNLSHDLASGEDVEWLPYVQNIGPIGQQLDDENTGVVLESNSLVNFVNNEGYFDDIFDSLIWENQNTEFYSWFGGLNKSEIKKIFSGVIESKDFLVNNVRFKVKDFIYKLKDKIDLPRFTELDGDVPDNILNTSKKLIYGKADKVKCIPVDAIKDGFALSGTVSFASGSKNVNGTGTQFLKELSPSDKIIVLVDDVEVELTVDAIESDVLFTVARDLESSATNVVAKNLPDRPYRFKNREWSIAGHRIRESVTTLIDIINLSTIIVNDASEFFDNDIVEINNQFVKIQRISGNTVFLAQTILPPSIGSVIKRSSVTAAYFGLTSLVPGRDYSIQLTNESKIILDDKLEFNIAKEILGNIAFNFIQNSRDLTMTTLAVDLRTIIKPRDWIRPIDLNEWYEVLSVTEKSLKLRTPFLSPNKLATFSIIKNVDLIDDRSLILVDCYGKELNNKWVKTPADGVRDLLGQADITNLNIDSFNQANSDCNFVLSAVFPEDSGDPPSIRDIITGINESVFGSLYSDDNQNVAYSILNTRKDSELESVQDDDIISWSVQSSQKIINKVILSYAPFTDQSSGEQSTKTVEYVSDFVNQNIGIKNTEERTVYLYNDSEALIIAQRIAFYSSLSQSIVNIKAKSSFMNSYVNDRVYLSLDRLYRRYGGPEKKKIGVISGIKKNTFDTEIVINDLGNIFNRSMGIAPTGSASFTLADDSEKIKYGYLVDDNTLTPDPLSEDGLGSNLIG